MQVALIILIVVLSIIALGYWFIADLKFTMNWSRERAELGAAGKWDELNTRFEKRLKCKRPLLLIFEALMIPGANEADYAMHIYLQGQHEKALQLVDRAAKKAARKPMMLSIIYVSRAQVLIGLGRYEEARQAAAQAKSLNPAMEMADVMEAMADLNNGLLDSVLARMQRPIDDPACRDTASALASTALSLKGCFQEAVNALLHEPTSFPEFLSEEELEVVTETDDGRKTVAATDKHMASVTKPALHIGVAQACLEAGDVTNFGLALDKAKAVLKPNPGMVHIYHRLRALHCALNGDAQGTESNLSQARDIVKSWPSRSAKYEIHLATGRAQLILGQPSTALSELRQAIQVALHPLEKHTTNYWLGRAAEAANQPEEATRHYNALIAQNFDTWMTTDARQRLDPTAPKLPPPPRQLSIEA